MLNGLMFLKTPNLLELSKLEAYMQESSQMMILTIELEL